MSVPVLFNLLKELRKRDIVRGASIILSFFEATLMNSIIQEYEC